MEVGPTGLSGQCAANRHVSSYVIDTATNHNQRMVETLVWDRALNPKIAAVAHSVYVSV